MDIKVIFSSGGKYNNNPDQKIADEDTLVAVNKVVEALKNSGHSTDTIKITPSKIDSVKKLKAHAVFNLCEWSGKDYPLGVEVLKNLESYKIPHTGADSKSYEWCCDKIVMKKMFDSFGIPTPKWTFVDPKDNKKTIVQDVVKLKFPIIIKPAYEHCAIGINKKSVIRSKKEFVKNIASLLKKYKEPILVEEFIEGREFTITVVKNHRLHIFPPAEVIFKTKNRDKLLAFDTKWYEDKPTFYSKVVSNKVLSQNLKNLARKAFIKMECKGYVRVDVRMKRDNFFVLEINVNPSILPEECYGLTVSTEAAGWTFNKLVDEITKAAVTNQIQSDL